MLGFSLKYIDGERMVLDDWLAEYEVFEYSVQWDSEEEEESAFF